MKKIFTISFVLFLSLFSFNNILCQEIFDIHGDTYVDGNKGYNYIVLLETGLSQYTEFEIKTNYGKFDSPTGTSSKLISSSVGTTSFSFIVYWPNECFNDGFILVYKKGEPSKTYELKIRKISCESSTNNDEIIQGPPKFVFSKEPFSIGALSFTSVIDDIDFTYDSNVFEKVSTNKGKITLKPKQVVGKVSTTITVVFRHYIERYKYQWTFDVYGTPYISKNSSVICPGNTTFEIKNFLSLNFINFTSTTVNWQGVENMVLISGQNSNNPVFRASNGIGKVKATVTWRGNNSEKVFELEETYWVGVPKKVAYIVGMKDNQIFTPNRTYEIMISPETQFGTTELIWNSFDERIKIEPFLNGNIYGAYLKIPEMSGTTPFAIRVIPVNSCGKGTELIVWGAVTSNGLRSLTEISTEDIYVKTNNVTSVKIYSMSGVVVYSSNSVDMNFNYKDLNIHSGIYIIEKTFQDGNIIREKIII